MAKLTIIGTDKPRLGKEEKYSISMYGDWLHLSKNPFITPMKAPKTIWHIMVQTKTGWRRAEKNKEGLIVPYTFNQKSLMHKGIKIVVEQGENSGELIVHPQRAKEPKITKVELLDGNYKPIPKGKQISYRDTIIARAHCVEMFKMNVAFTLWEDDAQGEGHDPIKNALNKINLIPVLKPVNEKGIAEAVFRLPAYTMAVQIANARIAAGDKNEGKTHEYYVTADIVNTKIQKASPNVNVTNPTYNPEPPKRQRTLPQKPKPASPPAEKPKPKPDSPKFPVTSNGKSNTDREGKILSAEFVDTNGNRLNSSKVGKTVIMKITAKDLINKKVKVIIWEEDNFTWTNDEIYNKDWILTGDVNFIGVSLTKKMFDKANDGGGDSQRQQYFIEVIYEETSVKSSVMPITLDAEPTKIPKGKSDTVIKEPKQNKTNSTCICKEQYKDLYWGGKVSCEFRKKVIEISKRQGIDPNNFMAAMAHETGGTFDSTCGTFKKHKNEEKEGYVGLIQIGKDAAKDIGITRTELLKMNQLDQLVYIEKYLAKHKGKLNTLTDFYLAILFPVDCGKGNQPEHTVFDNSLPISYKNGKPIKNLNYWRNVAYSANPAFHKEGKKESGKTYVWEIAENIQIWYDKGKSNKPQKFTCNSETPTSKPTTDKGLWNVIITEKYTGSKCTHIEKTPIRANCRRGKIDVYDHNGKVVLTISDCLLEGIAGEDRSITDSDAPYGTYQIASDPFIMGSSSGDKRTSYGPNPRLSFEPIKGLGDEADKSGRSLIRIHGGRQETKKFSPRTNPNLLRTHGCIRVWDSDAKRFYDWWVDYHKNNPNIKPGKLTLKK